MLYTFVAVLNTLVVTLELSYKCNRTLLVSHHQLSLSKYAYNWRATLVLSNLSSPSAEALINFHLTFPSLNLIVGYMEIPSSHLKSYSTVCDLTPVICVCFRSTADGQHHQRKPDVSHFCVWGCLVCICLHSEGQAPLSSTPHGTMRVCWLFQWLQRLEVLQSLYKVLEINEDSLYQYKATN